jgi:type I restriction enzyme S subunit
MKDSWKEISLVDLALFRRGSFPQPYGLDKWYDDNNGMPFIQVYDVDDNMKLKRVTKRKISKLGAQMSVFIPKGSLILTIQGSIGRVAITDYDAYMDRTLLVFQKFYEEVDLRFIMYIIRELFNVAKENANGSTIKTITKEELSDYTINLPPLPQQQKIAKILSTVDNVIEKTESAIAKYQAIKQGLMHDLFTRGIDVNTGKLRPKPQDAPELYKESDLGLIPREWEVEELGDFIEAIDPQPSHRTPPEFHNGTPYLGINDIQNGEVQLSKCRLVNPEVLIEHKKRYSISEGDIIFGKIGTIGSPKRLSLPQSYSLSANVILIKPFRNKDLVYHYLNSKNVENQISRKIHTTSQPAFGMEKIRSLLFFNIPQIEANILEKKLNSIDKKNQTEQQALSKYQKLKAGLLQDLLTGKVEVAID